MIDANWRHVRRSIRLPRFDYAQPGMYYVTMVTHRRENHFGDIRGGSVFLNVFGKIANYFWQLLPDHFPHIELDEFIVMPNHIHGVIAINRPPGAINRAPTVWQRNYYETPFLPFLDDTNI